MQRPDLQNIPNEVIEYIEYLESLVPQKKSANVRQPIETPPVVIPLAEEAPSASQIINISNLGFAKRTPRHLYIPQHRGGTGNPDLQIEQDDTQKLLSVTNDGDTLLLFTNLGRVFRLPSNRLEEKSNRQPGDWVWDRIELQSSERIAAVLPVIAAGYIAMVTRTGRVRTLRHHLFGEHMRTGMSVFSPAEHGEFVSACWTNGDQDLLICTKNGTAIRFSEKLVPPMGDQAIRLSESDEVVSITAVYPESDVFTATADGRGSLRQMSGFSANKSLGGGGKMLIKSDHVISSVAVKPDDHIFLLTKLGKVIRFPAAEMPVTDAPVQGVNCITLRGDEVISMIKSGRPE